MGCECGDREAIDMESFDASKFPKTVSGPSTVTGADLGLFAGETIAKGRILVEYTGRNLSLSEAKVLKNRMYLKAVSGFEKVVVLTRSHEVQQASFNHHIDGSVDYASKAKYINDHIDKSKHNVKFITAPPAEPKGKKRVFVKASREIRDGEELFVDYGRGHWLFNDLPEFLGLEVVKDGSGKPRQLRTVSKLEKNEVIAVYSSQLLDQHFHSFGKLVRFTAIKSSINTTLRKNPFIPNTIMLSALRQIESGEVLAASAENQLEVKTSTIAGKRRERKARVKLNGT